MGGTARRGLDHAGTRASYPRSESRPAERPAQQLRALAGELAGGTPAGRLSHRDVEPGVAQRATGGTEAAYVPILGEDGRRQQGADAVLAHERSAAGLAAGEGAPLGLHRWEMSAPWARPGAG